MARYKLQLDTKTAFSILWKNGGSVSTNRQVSLPSEEELLKELAATGFGHHRMHASGHATIPELQRFVNAFRNLASSQVTCRIERDPNIHQTSSCTTMANVGTFRETCYSSDCDANHVAAIRNNVSSCVIHDLKRKTLVDTSSCHVTIE